MTPPADICQHPAAYVLADIGDSGADDSEARGISWSSVTDDPVVVDGFDHLRAAVSLGMCGDCGALVVSVSMWDLKRWTVEHGPSWHTGWTPLVRPGQKGGDRCDQAASVGPPRGARGSDAGPQAGGAMHADLDG